MSNFEFQPQALEGLVLVKVKKFGDDRGYFMESYRENAFRENGMDRNFVQENRSLSAKNVLRGLHFQREPRAQGKLIQVLMGEILDVAVDIRPDSPTFLKWMSFRLSSENALQLYLPEGFAHGFAVFSEQALISYKTTDYYAPDSEGGILWNDPQLNIDWQIAEPQLSDRDRAQATIKEGALNG